MHEEVAPVSKRAETGSVLNNLMMKVANFPFTSCMLDTTWSKILRSSSYSVPNKLSSLSESDSELRSGNRKSEFSS